MLVPRSQAVMLQKQLRKKGYRSMLDFTDTVGITRNGQNELMSYEPVRRAFAAGEAQISDLSMAFIMHCLDFSTAEIDNELELRGDRIIRPLIRGRQEFSSMEVAIIAAIQKLSERSDSTIENIADYLELMAKASRVDIEKEIAEIKGVKKRRNRTMR